MGFKCYKLTFQNAHFGDGYLNTSKGSFPASLLFSALCLEALKNNCLDEFIAEAQQDDFFVSDAFPYVDEPYLPKPIGLYQNKRLDFNTLAEDQRISKKAAELTVLPYSQLTAFIEGDATIDDLYSDQVGLYDLEVLTKKGADPYEVALTRFNSSLYIIAQASELFDQLMTSLQYSGLGGKRSSGYGAFSLEIAELNTDFLSHLNKFEYQRQLLLTTSLPKNNELTKSLLGAQYKLEKTSGFTYSETAGVLLRKNDLYKFSAGSVFLNPYLGSIVDVSPANYAHPVYNFAKGLFYGF